jgi:hypothetical protein
LSKVSVTSAKGCGGRESEPLKITSSIDLPRRWRALCSPMHQRIASTVLLLPQPLGPTTAVTSCSKVSTVRSTKDLNPCSSSLRIFIGRLRRGAP